ncbi:phage tail protein [Pseudomonas asplenii]|uniref:phage tail-collar fiber domain-containing protein n=1 Tax=Pseudomonas asplenii TaxID=53407 RepID=UPI0023602513|nr:phage tail protein [Pseudomonas asplenii]
MGATITVAGENLIAQKAGSQQSLIVSRFILANVPGLDPTAAVDRTAGTPPAAQIVGTFNVTRAGYVNTNQVVYSLMLGSDVGDFDWNWIGLETAENVLLSVAYVPLQQKRKNILPAQIGNNVTRNFLLVFDGAKALTGVSIDASTWQHDFTIRLVGIDERERQANKDIFGRACFLGSAMAVTRVTGSKIKVDAGTAYIEGIRVSLEAPVQLDVPANSGIWIDVSLQRNLSDVVARWSFSATTGNDKQDYTDAAGARHYCVKIATVSGDGTLLDTRPMEPIYGPIVSAYAVRNGDYPLLRARRTTKEDVGLGNLPNAINHSPYIDNLDSLATSRAVNSAMVKAEQELDRLTRSLGTAAKLNAGTDDGNVMKVGAFGLGAAAVDISGKDPTAIVKSGFYVGSNIQNAPDATWWFVNIHSISDLYCRQIWYSLHGTRLLTRSQTGGQWQPFVEFYHKDNLNPDTIVPAGTLMQSFSRIAPAGSLRCNGAAVSRTTFAALFASIGTNYGAGDGATTFNLPDTRGVFIRDMDDGKGFDPGRYQGTIQTSANLQHTHTATTEGAGSHSHAGSKTAAAGSHSHNFNYINTPTSADSPGVGAAMHHNAMGWVTGARIQAAGEHVHDLNITADGTHTHAVTVASAGGNESRPVNMALYTYIKY